MLRFLRIVQLPFVTFVNPFVPFVACLLTVVISPAQNPIKKLKAFSIEEPSKVSIDRLGNFYLVSRKGLIRKYDTDGNFMNEFSDPESETVTILEPWNPLRVFIYNRKEQQVLLLDRFLLPMEKITLDPSLAIEPILASPIPNNNFWLLDKADFSLKKIDAKATLVMEEVMLKLPAGIKPDFTFLREYQNQLFLIDQQSGIQIHSVVGKPIRTLPVKNLTCMGFLGQEVYYLESGKVKFYDLYSEEQHELAVDPLAQFVLITDERMILIKKSVVEVWEYKP